MVAKTSDFSLHAHAKSIIPKLTNIDKVELEDFSCQPLSHLGCDSSTSTLWSWTTSLFHAGPPHIVYSLEDRMKKKKVAMEVCCFTGCVCQVCRIYL
jgi:hypothetical protein